MELNFLRRKFLMMASFWSRWQLLHPSQPLLLLFNNFTSMWISCRHFRSAVFSFSSPKTMCFCCKGLLIKLKVDVNSGCCVNNSLYLYCFIIPVYFKHLRGGDREVGLDSVDLFYISVFLKTPTHYPAAYFNANIRWEISVV